MKRTYSRKRQRRAPNLTADSAESDSEAPSPVKNDPMALPRPSRSSSPVRKRQRVDVEVMADRSATRARTSRATTGTPQASNTIREESPADRHKNEPTPPQRPYAAKPSNFTPSETLTRARVKKSFDEEQLTDVEDVNKETGRSQPQESETRPRTPTKVHRTYLSRTPQRSIEAILSSSLPAHAGNSATVSQPSTSRPSTPSKSARDLSHLFEFTPTSRPGTPKLPPKPVVPLVKRMLGRSKTESSIESGGSGSLDSMPLGVQSQPLGARTDTVLDLSRSPSSSASLDTPRKSRSANDVSPSPFTSPSRPPIIPAQGRTYAGPSRSFLVALPASQYPSATQHLQQADSQESLLGYGAAEDPEMADAQRESYTSLRARWGVDNSEDDPYPSIMEDSERTPTKGKGKQAVRGAAQAEPLPNGMMNNLKSISELRSKGESRRFLDEVGYLFEGLESSAVVAVRRASALELVTKLCDRDFLRRAKAVDCLQRTWDMLRTAGGGEGDKVLDAVLVFFAALVAREPRDLLELAEKSDLVDTLLAVLSKHDRVKDALALVAAGVDDARLKRVGVQRAEKSLFVTLSGVARKKSGIAFAENRISTSLCITKVLSALPLALLPPREVASLVKSLAGELRLAPPRLAAYAAGLPIIPASSSAADLDVLLLEHIEHCLVLLDAFLLGRWAADNNADNDRLDHALNDAHLKDDMTRGLISACVVADVLSRQDDCDEAICQTAHNCIDYSFRVLVNLSHDDPAWCRDLLKNDLTLQTILRFVSLRREYTVSPVKKEEPEEELVEAVEDDPDTRQFDRLCLALGLLTNLLQSAQDEVKDSLREISLDPTCRAKRLCATGRCRCAQQLSGLDCLALVYIHHAKTDTENAESAFVRGHVAVLFGFLMRGSPANQVALLAALPGTSDQDKVAKIADNAREFVVFYSALAKGLARASGETSFDSRAAFSGGENNTPTDVLSFLEDLRDTLG